MTLLKQLLTKIAIKKTNKDNSLVEIKADSDCLASIVGGVTSGACW